MPAYVTTMSTLSNLSNYLKYCLNAKSAHGVHSPFVYKFITELLENRNEDYYQFMELDKVRKQLLEDDSMIEITDFGAGSKVFKDNKRKISDIARHGISKKKYSELYFKLVNFTNSQFIVELGTSLGLNTLYLSKANTKAVVYSIEGCPELARFAANLFKKQETKVFLINNTFENAFPLLLKEIPRLDFLYVDGNHNYDSTLSYFRMALENKHNNSVFIFDDINWNEDMRKAWEEIKANPEVTLSIDLYYTGIVFFRKEQQEKEHFVLKY
jgi:predicted O-methyltransferase YrrM